MIRKMAEWHVEENWNVPEIYLANGNAILYDVSTAFKSVSKGGGWAAKRQKVAAASAAEEALE